MTFDPDKQESETFALLWKASKKPKSSETVSAIGHQSRTSPQKILFGSFLRTCRQIICFLCSPGEETESAEEDEESVGVKGNRLFSVWVIKSRAGRISSGKPPRHAVRLRNVQVCACAASGRNGTKQSMWVWKKKKWSLFNISTRTSNIHIYRFFFLYNKYISHV